MKYFVRKLLFLAFLCLAFLIAINFKEIKKVYLEGYNQASSEKVKWRCLIPGAWIWSWSIWLFFSIFLIVPRMLRNWSFQVQFPNWKSIKGIKAWIYSAPYYTSLAIWSLIKSRAKLKCMNESDWMDEVFIVRIINIKISTCRTMNNLLSFW